MVATDIEMPRLDGLAVNAPDPGRPALVPGGCPSLPFSSLAGEEEIALGMAAGVTEYQIKLNAEELTDSIRRAVRKNAGVACA